MTRLQRYPKYMDIQSNICEILKIAIVIIHSERNKVTNDNRMVD